MKKLAFLSIIGFSLLVSYQSFAMKPPKSPELQKSFSKKLAKSDTDHETEVFVIDSMENYTTNCEFKINSGGNSGVKDIKKIVYKPCFFNVITLREIKAVCKKECNIVEGCDLKKGKSSNVDFDIIFDFGKGKTIEFEVRLGELAVDKSRILDISKGIAAYNEFLGFLGRNPITKGDIQEFEFPNNVKAVNDCAFARCENLKNVNITNCVKKIGKYVFANCTNLKSVTIQTDTKDIGEDIFRNCRNLEKIICNRQTYYSPADFIERELSTDVPN